MTVLPTAVAVSVPVVSMGPATLKEDVDRALFQVESPSPPIIPVAAVETIMPLLVTVTPLLIFIGHAMVRFAVELTVRFAVIVNPVVFEIPVPPDPSMVAPAPLKVIRPEPLKVPFTRRLPPTPIVYGEPASVAPELTVRAPLIVVLVPNVVVPVGIKIIRLLNVCEAAEPFITWASVPLKVTVPVPGVNVPPLLVQLPATLILEAVPAIKVAPAPIVTFPETLSVVDGVVKVPPKRVTLVVVTVPLEPVNVPLLIVMPPLKVTGLVPPVKVPPLFTRLPAT